MSTLELVIRTVGATAAIILSAGLANARGAPAMGRWCGALLCLGVASYLPCSAASNVCSTPPTIPAIVLAGGVPFFFWGWTRSIMDDDFRFTPLPIVAAALLVSTPLIAAMLRSTPFTGFGVIVHSILGIAFVAAALIDVLRTWRQDLIEARRRLRLVVLVVCGGYSIAVLGVELFLQTQPAGQALQLINASLLALLLLALSATLLGVSDRLREAFGWTTPPPQTTATLYAQPIQPAAVSVRDPEQELIDKLHARMTGKAMYRDAALSVSGLANALGVQEKRLREIINRRLGHKNFPSYVNAYRLEEVRLRLADARNDRLPILTLALDAGFGSVVAFNRAFKDKYGTTPTEYRARWHVNPKTVDIPSPMPDSPQHRQ